MKVNAQTIAWVYFTIGAIAALLLEAGYWYIAAPVTLVAAILSQRGGDDGTGGPKQDLRPAV